MQRNLLAAALAASFFTLSAHAATFVVPISGAAIGEFDPGVWTDRCPDPNADSCVLNETFTGTMTIKVPNLADGIYLSDISLSIDPILTSGDRVLFPGYTGSSADGYTSATLSGGALTDVSHFPAFYDYLVGIEHGSFSWLFPMSHGSESAKGVYELSASELQPVPEPAAWLMLALGVGATLARRQNQKIDA